MLLSQRFVEITLSNLLDEKQDVLSQEMNVFASFRIFSLVTKKSLALWV